ncbi:hypothetical protein H8959_011101 [Pygathrix nigripes]
MSITSMGRTKWKLHIIPFKPSSVGNENPTILLLYPFEQPNNCTDDLLSILFKASSFFILPHPLLRSLHGKGGEAQAANPSDWVAASEPAATASEQKMSVPPMYADLGKSVRDVFTKGYGFGVIKLDLKTKSENGLEFTSSGSANTETTKVTGSLETKYKWTECGLTFTKKWNTDNTLGTEITVEDQLARGLKLTFDSSFSPNTGKKNAKIKTGYKREHINLGCDMDFDIAEPSIRGALVLG